jgi:hypothetical protein
LHPLSLKYPLLKVIVEEVATFAPNNLFNVPSQPIKGFVNASVEPFSSVKLDIGFEKLSPARHELLIAKKSIAINKDFEISFTTTVLLILFTQLQTTTYSGLGIIHFTLWHNQRMEIILYDGFDERLK